MNGLSNETIFIALALLVLEREADKKRKHPADGARGHSSCCQSATAVKLLGGKHTRLGGKHTSLGDKHTRLGGKDAR